MYLCIVVNTDHWYTLALLLGFPSNVQSTSTNTIIILIFRCRGLARRSARAGRVRSKSERVERAGRVRSGSDIFVY